MRHLFILGYAVVALTVSTAAAASETIAYNYDARGRLKQASHSGTVNNGVTTSYTYDKAHNRSAKSE